MSGFPEMFLLRRGNLAVSDLARLPTPVHQAPIERTYADHLEVIADQYLGKLKTILVFCGVYWVGLLILWTTALPASIDSGASLGGFIAAIIVIGFGTGGIKSNIAPLIADVSLH